MSQNEQLFNEHLHLAEATVYKLFPNTTYIMKKRGLELDDLFQYAREALWEAVLKFDQSKGRTFKNFAITNMRWSLIEMLRKDYKKFNFRGTGLNPNEIESKTTFISFDATPTIDDEESSTYHELIGNDYNLEGEAMGNLMEELIPPRTLEFLKMKMNGLTLREIARTYGISHQAVSHDIKKFGNKLKEVI